MERKTKRVRAYKCMDCGEIFPHHTSAMRCYDYDMSKREATRKKFLSMDGGEPVSNPNAKRPQNGPFLADLKREAESGTHK